MSASALVMRGLYAVTPDQPDTARLLRQVDAALRGGARVVQYRNKRADPSLAREQAAALRETTTAYAALLIVNDSFDLALAVGADGVHLGRDDAAPVDFADLRRRAARAGRTRFMIGVSCYNELARAEQAAEAGADYLAFGSFFPSSVKPEAVRAGLELIGEAKRRHRLPVVAIGGIDLQNAPQLLSDGVDAVAVISALFDNDDIEGVARAFTALFQAHVQHQ